MIKITFKSYQILIKKEDFIMLDFKGNSYHLHYKEDNKIERKAGDIENFKSIHILNDKYEWIKI